MPDRIPDESPREREILQIIHAAGPLSVAEVRERMKNPPSYSAVRTMLTRVVAKGYLRYRQEGLRYVYSPAKQKDSVRRKAVQRVVDIYFGGSISQAVNAMIDERSGAITPDEEREIRKRLAAARKEGK